MTAQSATRSDRDQPLDVGLFLPAAPGWSELKRLAQQAESVGFDSVWLMDHLLIRAGDRVVPTYECWSTVAALGATLQKATIGTLVTAAPFRNPAMLAKIVDTVADVCQGRLILGLGAGWYEPEFQAFGYPFDHRVSRFEESLRIIHGLLHEGQVDFEGTYYQTPDCVLAPHYSAPDRPPIMVGASGERMLYLTARYADLWNGCWYADPSDTKAALAKVDRACREVGRDPASLGRTAGVLIDLPGRRGRTINRSGPIRSSPDEIAEVLWSYAAAGFS